MASMEHRQGFVTEIQNFKIQARKLVDALEEKRRDSHIHIGSVVDQKLKAACTEIELAIRRLDEIRIHDV